MIQITLTDKEYKLLMSVLKDCDEERLNMGCNDPYKNEQKMFTKDERNEMKKIVWGKKYVEDMNKEQATDGFLFNNDYVSFIINRIKKSKKQL